MKNKFFCCFFAFLNFGCLISPLPKILLAQNSNFCMLNSSDQAFCQSLHSLTVAVILVNHEFPPLNVFSNFLSKYREKNGEAGIVKYKK